MSIQFLLLTDFIKMTTPSVTFSHCQICGEEKLLEKITVLPASKSATLACCLTVLAFCCVVNVLCGLSGAPWSGFPVRRHNSAKVGQKQKLSVWARGSRENWKLYFSVSVIKGPLNFIQQTIIPRQWWISGSAAAATNQCGLKQEPMKPDRLLLSPAGPLVSAAHNAPVTHAGSAALQKSARPALVHRHWWGTSSLRPSRAKDDFSLPSFSWVCFSSHSLWQSRLISAAAVRHTGDIVACPGATQCGGGGGYYYSSLLI